MMLSGMGESVPELSPVMRASVHDLRNLFGIVGSAQRILEGDPDAMRMAMVAQALQLVVRDGIALTTRLLAQSDSREEADCDPARTLRELEVMLIPFGSPRTLIRVEALGPPARVGIGALDLQAIALEIVSNSLKAHARHIALRGRTAGRRYWLLGADDGEGCDWEEARGAFLDDGRQGSAHGSGLARIGRALGRAGSLARMRSLPNKGCVVGLAFELLPEPAEHCD